MPDIPVGKSKTKFFIILYLPHHPVDADVPFAQPAHCLSSKLDAIPFAAQCFSDDIKAYEPEGFPIRDRGDTTIGSPFSSPIKKPCGSVL